MEKWKVVVTDWEFEDLGYERSVLEEERFELVGAQCRTEEEVIEACRDADALINQYAPMSKRVLEGLEKCKVITRYGVGVNTIDVAAATERRICIANVPDYCIDEVSDHTFALLLSWARKIILADQTVKSGKWDFKVTRPIHRLRGRTLGLIGFGKIPQALAEKVKPFGLSVVAFDPYCPEEVGREKGVTLISLDELCSLSDIVSVHVPLTDTTKGMIGEKQFRSMKEHAFIINTSRGPVIDESALIKALEDKRIAGAALDVVEQEPIPRNHPLLAMENVIFTPHVAWYSEEAEKEMRQKAVLGVKDVLLHNRYPKYLVNKSMKDLLQLEEAEWSEQYMTNVNSF
ncbi:C-terminal binding protein [Pseudalkalibacillus salsuginis]|uniref:C-terminal binding protein n=1 Tax=Pseudalkalibacillus salsuginis TaxID=2910972 RepID=UPI001F3829F6|nr:C-terminal binding protein [Pseudalkalibacillus salsuginis]MCF6411337.1 C-terminal binding protein [Pseudalkalibacillus salsuginis]